MCRFFREKHGVFASVGILFNHESELRRPDFVSRKITRAAAAIKLGLRPSKLVVGDLSARTDWGYAPDFVAAFVDILGLDEPDDFVVATGSLHRVRDLAEAAFAAVELDWRDWVVEDASLLSRRAPARRGNPAKLTAATGWRPRVGFQEMVERMVAADLAYLESRAASDGKAAEKAE